MQPQRAHRPFSPICIPEDIVAVEVAIGIIGCVSSRGGRFWGVRAMSWTTAFDATRRIVEVAYTGSTTADDLRASTSSANALAKRYGTDSVLVDATKGLLDASLFDVFNLPALHFTREEVALGSRIALTAPKSAFAYEAAKFFTRCCEPRGWICRVFPDRHTAIKWLLTEKDIVRRCRAKTA